RYRQARPGFESVGVVYAIGTARDQYAAVLATYLHFFFFSGRDAGASGATSLAAGVVLFFLTVLLLGGTRSLVLSPARDRFALLGRRDDSGGVSARPGRVR